MLVDQVYVIPGFLFSMIYYCYWLISKNRMANQMVASMLMLHQF